MIKHKFIKIIFFGFIFLVVGVPFAFSEKLYEPPFIIVGKIPAGNKEGEIGIYTVPEGDYGPQDFDVRYDFIYIPDLANNRLNIFDINLNYIKIIHNSDTMHVSHARKIFILKNKFFLYSGIDDGLTLCDYEGKIIFQRPPEKITISLEYGENIYYIQDKLILNKGNGELEIISENGEMSLHDNGVKSFLSLNSIENGNKSLLDNEIEEVQNTDRFLYYNGKFYSNRFKENQKYYDQNKLIVENDKSKNIVSFNSINDEIDINIADYEYYAELIGYDNDHNSYWKTRHKNYDPFGALKQLIFVYSEQGKLLTAFLYGEIYKSDPFVEQHPVTKAKVTITANGDVWFLKQNHKDYTVYKVERNW